MILEKTFDKLEWDFLNRILDETEIGSRFTNAIKQIYKDQHSFKIINNENTKRFPLTKGTRQGCPLSPLLFIFVLEVMLSSIQENKEIIGIRLGDYEFKYSAYADDVMFLIEDPCSNIPILFDKIKEFGKLAGFS